MKRFTFALAFSSSLLMVLTFWLFGPKVKAKEDPVLTLLNLPAPPPPNPLVGVPTGTRPNSFYDKEAPPPDNAPIEDLLEYWSRQSVGYQDLGYNPKPSDTVMNRLLGEIEKDPKRISDLLNVMQDDKRGADLARDIYRTLSNAASDEDRELKRTLRQWLTRNTDEFSDDLAKVANTVRDTGEYVNNQDELLALTKVDWEKAGPIVNRLYNDGSQKVSKVLATWALYRRALETGSVGDTDRYRDELKAVVENKEATDAMRDLALDALVKEKDWSGRDEWYYSLLGDETLHELTVDGRVYTGLTTIMYYSPDDRYVDRMLQYAGSGDIWVRTAAVKNLMLRLARLGDYERNKKLKADIVQAVLPWLSDPKWIKSDPSGRLEIVRALQTVKLPDAVPALIAALDEKETTNTRTYAAYTAANSAAFANLVANAANSAANRPAANLSADNRFGNIQAQVYYPLRTTAISALDTQADGRANPALRRILTQVADYERTTVVKALLSSGGFTTEEQAEALEFVAKNAGDPDLEVPGEDQHSIQAKSRQALRSSLMSRRTVIDTEVPETEDADAEFETFGNGGNNEAEEAYTITNSSTYEGPETTPLTANEVKFLVGSQLVSTENVSDELVRMVADRITQNEKRDPMIAESLRQIMIGWNGRAVNTLLLRDLKSGRVEPDAVLKLLGIRKQLRAEQSNDITDLRTGSAAALGLIPCLSEDASSFESILDSGAEYSKIVMLSCARLIRAPLDVPKVSMLLKSPNKMLALAAERYLESEDSPEARNAVLAMYPGKAKILGATTTFEVNGTKVTAGKYLSELFASVDPYFASSEYVYYTFGYEADFSDMEKRLQREVTTKPELLGVYAYKDNYVHMYADRAVFSWSNDPARFRERVLEENEFENLKNYLAHFNVDQLAPFLTCNSECESGELLMIGRNGGRRVFLKTGDRKPEFFAGLDEIFEAMRQRPGKLKYWAGENLPGLEVIFADEKKSAQTVWKNGSDLRVLITDDEQEKAVQRELDKLSQETQETETEDSDAQYARIFKMRESRKYDSYGWFTLNVDGLGGATQQPPDAEFLPVKDGFNPSAEFGQWKAKAGSFEIRADSSGLYRIIGGRSVKIRNGEYSDAVVTSNGKWVVASHYDDETGMSLVRINLLTGKLFKINSDEVGWAKAICYVPSINRMLVTNFGEDDHHEGEDESYNAAAEDNGRGYYFLDPETGLVTPTPGEVRPLAQQSFRSLQPTGTPGEFWAALPRGKAGTIFGIYSSRTFILKPLLKLPKIVFDSTRMWVDAAESKVYFVYQGHVLSAPFSMQASPARPR
ncbi:MAG: HEAT repeat domain-containing protein [Pyrinomonadaceae bacterium]|nr:HEAT repeat domain-containing protein [Blastocatellia bacterium]MCW5955543.1 HEAT repeat domain-containing protein [Pyrinomonadaceae bacterium]